MTTQLQLIETAVLPTLSFKDPAAKVTHIFVERVKTMNERTGKEQVAYHKFLRAEGVDVRTGDKVEIDFTIRLYGKEAHAFNNIRITPGKWRDDMFDICRSHAVQAVRLDITNASYVITDPA